MGGPQHQHSAPGAGAVAPRLLHRQPGQSCRAAPEHQRVAEAGNAGGHPLRQLAAHIIPYRAQVEGPGEPAAFKRVCGIQRRVIGIHALLGGPPIGKGILRRAQPQRKITGQINAKRKENKQCTAARQRAHPKPAHSGPCARLGPKGLCLCKKRPKVQHGQPGTGKNARPFHRCGTAKSCARGRKARPGAAREARACQLAAEAQHAKRTGQNKKYSIGVDGADAALRKAHKVKAPQHSGQRGGAAAAAQRARQKINLRCKQHAEQGAHAAPSEWGHAEQGHAQRHNILAKGRVCGLVNRQPVHCLIGGARMVNLIEIHRVLIAGPCGHKALLVKQRLPVAAVHGQCLPAGVQKCQLKHLCAGDCHRIRPRAGKRVPHPGKAPAGRQLCQQHFAALRVLHAQLPARLGNALIHHQALCLAIYGGRHGKRALRFYKGLRRSRVAKARKRNSAQGQGAGKKKGKLAPCPAQRHGRRPHRLPARGTAGQQHTQPHHGGKVLQLRRLQGFIPGGPKAQAHSQPQQHAHTKQDGQGRGAQGKRRQALQQKKVLRGAGVYHQQHIQPGGHAQCAANGKQLAVCAHGGCCQG